MCRRLWLLLICISFPVACTPALDWREVRPEGTELLALLPCKPATDVRTVAIGAQQFKMTMSACRTAGAAFVLSHVEVGDPQRVGAVMAGLMIANQQNVGATAVSKPTPIKVPGMTPNAQSGQTRFVGRLPDGRTVELAVASFVQGTQVFQASVVAPQIDAMALETYFSSLKFGG